MTSRDERHPVLWGLVALVSVAVVIGAVFGGAAFVGSRVLGLDGPSTGSGSSPGQGDSLYLPSPSPTATPAAPSATASSSAGQPSRAPTPITLVAGQRSVGVFGRIDLSGTYAQGEGAVLEVQRLEGGRWTDFYSVTAVVAGGAFSTNVQTSRTGVNVFRVVDSDSRKASNPVRVRVG